MNFSRSRLVFGARSRARIACAALLLAGASACASRGASFLPPSRPAQFSLAGVPWGIQPDSVSALIEPRGYNFNRVDEDGDMWFDGVLFRAPTRIYAFMGEKKQLVKMRVLIGTEDEDALTTYQNARAELVKQYGAPKETVEHYQAPYRKGDSKELQAIRSGKGEVHSYWLAGSGARATYVSVRVNEQLAVVVDYEGPAWDKESLRRRKGR